MLLKIVDGRFFGIKKKITEDAYFDRQMFFTSYYVRFKVGKVDYTYYQSILLSDNLIKVNCEMDALLNRIEGVLKINQDTEENAYNFFNDQKIKCVVFGKKVIALCSFDMPIKWLDMQLSEIDSKQEYVFKVAQSEIALNTLKKVEYQDKLTQVNRKIEELEEYLYNEIYLKKSAQE